MGRNITTFYCNGERIDIVRVGNEYAVLRESGEVYGHKTHLNEEVAVRAAMALINGSHSLREDIAAIKALTLFAARLRGPTKRDIDAAHAEVEGAGMEKRLAGDAFDRHYWACEEAKRTRELERLYELRERLA